MAKEKSKGLGKGLGALFGGDVSLDALTHPPVSTAVEEQEPPVQEEKQTSEENTLQMLPIDSIHENPWQPRRDFDADALLDLTESIREKGVLSPLIVAQKDGDYLLVAGERRLRAAKQAGLTEVPVILRTLSDEEIAQIALIENIQRADLNVVEEANGYAALIKTYHYTQQQLADLMGKSRPYIANLLRLLDLPEPSDEGIAGGQDQRWSRTRASRDQGSRACRRTLQRCHRAGSLGARVGAHDPGYPKLQHQPRQDNQTQNAKNRRALPRSLRSAHRSSANKGAG